MRAARHPRIYEAAASTPGFPLGLFPVYIQDICQLHIDAIKRCARDDERRQRILPETTAGRVISGHELRISPGSRAAIKIMMAAFEHRLLSSCVIKAVKNYADTQGRQYTWWEINVKKRNNYGKD